MINNIIKKKSVNEHKENCEHVSDITDSSNRIFNVAPSTESYDILENDIMVKSKSRKVGISVNNGFESTSISNKILSEFTCPVCLDYYILPVTIPCGHTFCRYCITHNRLLGKNCPVCRQLIGYNFRINMAIHNVIVSLGIFKQSENSSWDERNDNEILFTNNEFKGQNRPKWWQLCFCKPIISVTLFARIISDEILGIGIIFAEDLTRCIIDHLSKLSSMLHNTKFKSMVWSNGIYMIGPLEVNLLTKWMGCPPLPFNLDDDETDHLKKNTDFTLNSNAVFKNQVKKWVEECIALKPTILNIGQSPFIKTNTYPIIRILSDRIHRVESKIYDLGTLRSPLPWDLGRHSKSTIHISHSSVSTNHLLIVNIKEHAQVAQELKYVDDFSYIFDETSSIGKDWGIGIIDLGSSIGTMLKIQSKHRLATDEIIHLADRVEIIVKIRTIEEIINKNNYLHFDNQILINEWKKLRWSNKLNLVVNIDEYGKNKDKTDETKNSNFEDSFVSCNKDDSISLKFAQESEILQIPLEELELEEIKECLEVYIPTGSKFSVPCEGAKKTEDGMYWSVIIHPSGMVFGRGKNGALGLRKVEVTESNGYISREHCIFYYSSVGNRECDSPDYLSRSKGCLSNWYVKDVSTSGTFLRLKPFSYPVRLLPGMVLKVGQCKMEILPYMIGALYSGQPNSTGRNNTINLVSQDFQQIHTSSTEDESLQTHISNLNQIPISLGNGTLFAEPSSNQYLSNINNNVIAQLNILAAYNYFNASSITNLVNSSNIINLNNQAVEERVSQTQNSSLGQMISIERSPYDNIFLQNILSNSLINNSISTNNYLGNMQNDEYHSITESSMNSLEVNDILNYERRPREPRVTQEGDVSFQIDSYENSNDC
ncbi:RING finger domain-containing protein [Cryptosporidium ubiquitum]|uniref:E3 ubiquitin-protein ligase CHFR n=1 Tax=Cryptosporidium ubiquitum TaxID=857276 RepID=A0A1J4MLF3_9CRYT|nr:RING finger domain-containing protein [Cryptosporidium ubiquitum]OII74871.1 RING finger domain-containing protein [Cryptosporidium ubiquitum]